MGRLNCLLFRLFLLFHITLDPQMETRTFTIHPNESAEQTEKIQRQQAFWDANPWEKEKAISQVQEIRKLVRWIRDYGVKEVVIPYAELIKLPVTGKN